MDEKKDSESEETRQLLENNGHFDEVWTDVIQPSERNTEDVDEEAEKKKEEEEKKKLEIVSFTALFRYANALDGFLMFIATLASIGNGMAQPISFILFGKVIDKFIAHGAGNLQDIGDSMKTFAYYYIALAGGMFVCSYFQAAFWSMSAVRQIHRIRLKFFKSILKQDVGWFDVNESGGLTTRLTDDLIKIQTGLGDKLGMIVSSTTMLFGGMGVGFYYSWELTLVILAVAPVMAVIAGITGKVIALFQSKEQTAYASAGAVAEEVISSIKTVVAFGGEHDEIERYNVKLGDAEKAGIKKSLLSGAAFGLYHIIMFAAYALAFWHGSNMVIDGKIQGGDVLIVFFSVIAGAANLGAMSPNFEALATARGAAYHVFKICEREPTISCLSEEGKILENFDGKISFANVNFRYPSRPEVQVLDGFNLDIEVGTTVALVGESGCGKSTIVKLVQRFYDTEEGQICLDGCDVKDLNVKAMRSNIGVVSQEPVLFDMSIAENIQFGATSKVTQEEIEAAAKNANVHDFIMTLPKGYETNVGEGGAQLSGGQKQRIAIARALVRNPKILLFDEATSALDTESESIVQAALDKASKGRTTIIIAHRLSTVRNADVIVAVQDGKVAEKGSHKELMERKGVYHQLVLLQTMTAEEEGLQEDDIVAEMSKEDLEEIKKLKRLRTISGRSDRSADIDPELSQKFARQLSNQSTGSRKRTNTIDKDEAKKENEEEEEKVEPAPFCRVMKLNSSEWPYLLFGSFFSAMIGIFPVAFAVILSELIGTYQRGPDYISKESKKWAVVFVGLGFFDAIGFIFSAYLFGKAGEILTRRVRKKAFAAILRQDMSFFDEPKNSTGQLTARLGTDASNINGATSARLNTMIQMIVMGLTTLGIAFYYSWKLTLLIVGFVPFLALGGAAHMKVFASFAAEESERLITASALATQAIMNIRTVASLGKERHFIEKYTEYVSKPYSKSKTKANVFGLTFGLSHSIMMLANAAAFTLGGKLVQDGELVMTDMYKVILATVFGALIAGQISSIAPDFMKAKISAARIFLLLDRVPEIDSYSPEGKILDKVNGNIDFSEVQFAYPSRPDVKVLKGLSLQIQPGQKVALVGSSGCGKSTSIGLLERFYNPLDGSITIDNNEINTFNIKWLRSQLGLVSQEPILFARSIRDNISYGLDREVTEEEILSAATKSNIHSFVSSLPQGYDTMVGEKGTLISGGQKQRIAIARALIRDPKIMLLDEATSALDSESEKIVQDALDVAMEGRTSIIIAHRLSTIQNADMIVVIQNGIVVEQGTHQELLAKQGAYYMLNQAQL